MKPQKDGELNVLRNAVKVGLEQLDRGEGTEWNLEEAKAQLRRNIRQGKSDGIRNADARGRLELRAMSTELPRFVFVYGTLLPGLAPAAIADVVATLRVVGAGTVPGRLYHLGAYPGCILDADCGGVIHGQVMEIPDQAVLERLDGYEGYAAHDDAGSLFLRTVCDVTLGDGNQLRSWVYVYNRSVKAARLISGGRYHPTST